MIYFIDFIFRWLHVLFGIAWVGLLFYFNFVQGEYLKEATAEAKEDVLTKLAPRALWWFRWASVATLLTGLYLFYSLGASANQYIGVAALMGTIMFLNVWLVIWPKQKVVCGIVSGDKPAAAGKALLASRTNTVMSMPMLFGMLASKHGPQGGGFEQISLSDPGFIIVVVAILAIAGNGLFGRLRQLETINGVLLCSFALTALLYLVLHFL